MIQRLLLVLACILAAGTITAADAEPVMAGTDPIFGALEPDRPRSSPVDEAQLAIHTRSIKRLESKLADSATQIGALKSDAQRLTADLGHAQNAIVALWIVAAGPWLLLLGGAAWYLYIRRAIEARQADAPATEETRSHWAASATRRVTRSPSGVGAVSDEFEIPGLDTALEATEPASRKPTEPVGKDRKKSTDPFARENRKPTEPVVKDPKKSTVIFANPNWGQEPRKR